MGLFEVLNNRTHYNTARVNEVLCKEVQGYDRYAFKTALGQKQHQEALGLVVAKIRDEMVEGFARTLADIFKFFDGKEMKCIPTVNGKKTLCF